MATRADARTAMSDRRTFKRTVLAEGIRDNEKGTKVVKEDGYSRYYYPLSGIIKEVNAIAGQKITFRFDREAFKRIEKENPQAATIFYRYNQELFEENGKSCDMRYISTLYNINLEKMKQMVCEVERDVLRIVGMGDTRRQ
jgi:hypothetical protein